jgi:arylsulfatase A-like enzyme/Flp pilus assembly protein TadD
VSKISPARLVRRSIPVALAATLVGCGNGPDAARRKAADSNFLLVTIDTTRPDALGCYGGRDVATPNLDRLARTGVRFDCAISAVPLTLPSHATILTGAYPICHGVRDNGAFRLSDRIPTLADRLRAKGFRTGAVVGAFVLDGSFGLSRGFDVYDDRMPNPESGRGAFRSERRAEEVTAHALAFLEKQSDDRPFLLWVHYYDPHAPYAPPPPWSDKFSGDARRAYDGEVAYMDSEIGRLVDAVSRRQRATITWVLGDHGEAFGERGETSHGMLLHDTTTRVPMILNAPGILTSGTVVPTMVRTLDVVPTLAEIYDFPTSPEVQGKSIWSLAFGGRETEPREAYLETYAPELNFGWSSLRALRTDSSKYVDAPDAEFYDLAKDPTEQTNAIASRAADAEASRARLVALIERDTCPEGREILPGATDDASRKRLAAIGYTQAIPTAPADGSTPARENPKKKLAIFDAFTRGNGLVLAGKPAEAVSVFEPLASSEPRNVKVLDALAEAYADAGRMDDAERTLESALAVSPTYLDAITDLGLYQLRHGKFQESEATYGRALALDASSSTALFGRARALEQLGRDDDAHAAYRKAIESAPSDVEGRLSYAAFLANKLRKIDDAEVELQSLAKAAPGSERAALELGLVRLQKGDWKGAAESLEKAKALAPGDVRAHLALARVYQQSNEADRARDVLLEALKIEPKNPAILCNLGALLAPRERGKNFAHRYFATAIQSNPAAFEAFRASIDQWPSASAVRTSVAQALDSVGRHDDAVKELSLVVEREPTNADAREYLGIVLTNLKRYREADAALRELVRAQPERASAINDLAWLLATSEDPAFRKPDEAVALAERAVSLRPSEASYLDTLSHACEAAGDLDKAKDAMRRAVQAAPDDAEMKRRLDELEKKH